MLSFTSFYLLKYFVDTASTAFIVPDECLILKFHSFVNQFKNFISLDFALIFIFESFVSISTFHCNYLATSTVAVVGVCCLIGACLSTTCVKNQA